MGFKNAVKKIKRTLLCCRKEKKKPLLKIRPTTDVRRMDITEGMPDLTEADAKLIQEKATHDAYRLLSLQSHPPTQPATPTDPDPDPFASSAALSPTRTDPFASAAPSAAASTTHLPAPSPSPSSAHSWSRLNPLPAEDGAKDADPGVGKKIWDTTRRLSGLSLSRRSSTRDGTFYTPHKQGRHSEPAAGAAGAAGVVIELDDAHQPDEREDTKAGASVSVRGFEVVETVGGTAPGKGAPGRGRVVSSPLIERAGNAMELGESNDEEAERRPLVRV
ncbi:hypothetical protein P171DRAFT_478264 [Karstenula rhodostoma CBS 690.94]|uniref:Uncharacterized protein n=1 Tax=Karstenula rhodostoma CBS 690.94 TaxID=1392251 RepID=A0A9P4PVT7_9PLEO|nr:hypothetical protein P171DRAFT_478264 [Karstenula rhodostoma CBS 690.94]